MSSPVQSILSRLGNIRGLLFVVGSGLVGVLVGIALFTFVYANGLAYFGEDPQTCKQCHAMNKQFFAWEKGSHHTVACQECHIPERAHEPVQWLLAEADNGFWHSLKFTTGQYPTNIKIRENNREILLSSCQRCHSSLISEIAQPSQHSNQQIDCLRCHSEVGHKR